MSGEFKNKVYKLARLIPMGKVATYEQLARLAGKSKAARAVGVFMKNNPNPPIVPCHRVVASDGNITGYSGVGGIVQKKKMLLDEGVCFINDRVNLSLSQWKK
jgi:O-6-methylguanine DNA methyltransferase